MTNLDNLHQNSGPLDKQQKKLENLTPIQFAAKYGEPTFIAEQLALLNDKHRKEVLDMQDEISGLTALHFAARYGQIEVAKILLSYGASPDVQTKLQQLPVQSAFSDKNSKTIIIELFNLLNKNPAYLEHTNYNGETVAHLAAQMDIPEILSIIKEEDETLLNKKNNQSMTPLLVAILNNSIHSIPILLNTKSIKIKDSKSRNALHYATIYGNDACLSLIMPHFNINAPDGEGLTSMDFAVKQQDSEKIKVLKEAGAQ